MSLLTGPRMVTRLLASRSKTMAAALPDDLTVVHKPNLNKFIIDLPPQPPNHKEPSQAILEYEWIKDNQVDLYHTEVPDHFRGKGIAKVIAKGALDYFVDKNIKMELSCTYLAKFVKDTNYRSLAE
ncbi:protein NATD1 [Octopus bimaculoides]|uniref:Protein NATD1 n=1 Tax=Octopus bimaculoides TaxID=37653 RepID=A0A0L8GJY2_OCTBM|nr:protein NATD1 [Octopus bimaculoides]|eukprot:XP_014780381.1 PREDICTED: protein NATD1-like [Octopus bimaculoides]